MKSHKNKKALHHNDKINDRNSKMSWARMKKDFHYSTIRDRFNIHFWEADFMSQDIDDWFLTYCDTLEIKKQKEK